ncbi:hypothetical protein MKW94_002955 [Papaver nudicaule]|uniref:FBD domain-containing protein n=1 Tax=Papaver nudicaule TaxID=74823 RepID=A0AA41UV28_PAPNU|nr:hypothetical protein [Papaver nudicaule]
MNILLKFLEFLPNLESLIINQVIYSGKANENTMTFNKVPHCLVCLKLIEIRKFSWDPMELKIVKFVLKHARVLQMVILESSHTEEALNNKIRMQLGMSPWASADCVIKFSSS